MGRGPARMSRLSVVLPTLLLACAPPPRPAVESMSLNGSWLFRADADTAWMAATVPGTVHTDLMAAGRIPDPFRGDREEELRWIEDEAWSYRREFQVDPRLLRHDRLHLVFEGLDTWARVTLNGAQLLEADNMFRGWRVDVAGVLRPGTNTLEVRFDPPVDRGARRAAAHPWPIPHQEPDVAATRAFSRKAAYHFGWDWGPRYVTSGIWQPVRLEAWSGPRIVSAYLAEVRWTGPADGGATTSAEARLLLEVRSSGAHGPLRVGVRSPEDAFAPVVREVEAPTAGGTTEIVVPLAFPAAEPWWPRGTGRPAGRLYDIDVDVVQGASWDRRTLRAGLRTVELVTEPDSSGESFGFRVNGLPVFARGANVVPPDHFTPRADSATYARLIHDALAANMNMLRVWGGGVYLPDVFYDLADAAGLMVWQDFMFANTLVPGDSAFAASVAAEAEHQVSRLRGHPSIALWCGNNEVAEGWANWGWRDRYTPEVAALVDSAYRRIFHDVLPGVVTRLHPSASYVPSSPRLGWGHPESLLEGDSHYWGVWWGLEPFRVYAEKVPRFASEYGFQALPDPATVASFADSAAVAGGGLRRLDDPILRAHQKHPTGFETIRTYLERAWPVPPDDSLDAWIHVSQLAQAEGVGLALEAHRRSWPYTGGTLYWQLNDTWPVVSWSSVDHFGRWKALHYRARDVFAPLTVMADVWGDSVGVWVAADAEGTVSGTLTLAVRDFAGATLSTRTVPLTLPGGDRTGGWRGPIADVLPSGIDPARVWMDAWLTPQDPPPTGAILRDAAFFVPPKELILPDPTLRVTSVAPLDDSWTVSLTADRFAYGVQVALDGASARWSDNFFHLRPGDTVRVVMTPGQATPDVAKRVRLRWLRVR